MVIQKRIVNQLLIEDGLTDRKLTYRLFGMILPEHTIADICTAMAKKGVLIRTGNPIRNYLVQKPE